MTQSIFLPKGSEGGGLTEGYLECPLIFNIDKAGKYSSSNQLTYNEALKKS